MNCKQLKTIIEIIDNENDNICLLKLIDLIKAKIDLNQLENKRGSLNIIEVDLDDDNAVLELLFNAIRNKTKKSKEDK